MQKSYIEEQIDAVKEYLDCQKYIDELYEDKEQLKAIVINSDYWKNSQKVIQSVWIDKIEVDKSQTKYKNELKNDEYRYFIPGGLVIASLCEIYELTIAEGLKKNFGEKLDVGYCTEHMIDVSNYNDQLCSLQEELKKQMKVKFNLNANDEKLSADKIYTIVSELHDFETESKKLLLEFYKQEKNLKEEFECPHPHLFDLLRDNNLKTYIDDYKTKSLAEREKDPLRMIFRWNNNTQNYNLDNIKDIKEWFTKSITGMPNENRKDIYFVLLELFGKDFEFGGGSDGEIPKVKLWDKVDEKEVREWYIKNMPDTDLFDDLQIGEEKKTVIIEEQNYNNIDATAKENKSLIKDKNFNMDISKKNKKKNGTEKKQSKTSKTGYKIGLFLDILVTAVFVYLAITMSLYFLMALVVTVPLAIFFGLKLSASCLSGSCFKFGSGHSCKYEEEGDTLAPEKIPEQYIENDENKNEKPAKIVTKFD